MTSPKSAESPVSDFSIEHILNRAGNKTTTSPERSTSSPDAQELSWLQCTRYCPPKLPRSHKKEGPQKRQLGRHPRIPFSSQQLAVLEDKFKQSPYLSSSEVTQLSRTLQLADVRVKIWFQNRRARERREKNDPTSSHATLRASNYPFPTISQTELPTITNQISHSISPTENQLLPFVIPSTAKETQQLSFIVPSTNKDDFLPHQIEKKHKLDFRNINCFLKQENQL